MAFCHHFACRPSYAIPKLLDKTGMKLSDIDVFEYHEAFAVSRVCALCVCVLCYKSCVCVLCCKSVCALCVRACRCVCAVL